MRTTLLATALLTVVAATHAPAAHADGSVEARLKARGIAYSVDDDGDYVVTYDFSEEGRTQLAFVSGGAESIGGFSVREVFSPAGRVKADGIDGAKALELLAGSRRAKIGSWEIGGDILYFVIKLPDNADGAQLESALRVAAEVADDMEIELSGEKDAL